MLLTFTDAQTNNTVAINPNFVVVLFTAKDEDGTEKTVINTTTGNMAVTESFITVLGQLQGELK